MASSTKTFFTLSLLAVANLVAGHGAITGATGDAGGTGMALGIDTSTPRDGTRRNPFQQDSTRFRGAAADTVGETLKGGTNKLEAGTQAILAETGDSLPQVTAGGEVRMTLHQVNGDGAGPYTCMINADGTAQTWFVSLSPVSQTRTNTFSSVQGQHPSDAASPRPQLAQQRKPSLTHIPKPKQKKTY